MVAMRALVFLLHVCIQLRHPYVSFVCDFFTENHGDDEHRDGQSHREEHSGLVVIVLPQEHSDNHGEDGGNDSEIVHQHVFSVPLSFFFVVGFPDGVQIDIGGVFQKLLHGGLEVSQEKGCLGVDGFAFDAHPAHVDSFCGAIVFNLISPSCRLAQKGVLGIDCEVGNGHGLLSHSAHDDFFTNIHCVVSSFY